MSGPHLPPVTAPTPSPVDVPRRRRRLALLLVLLAVLAVAAVALRQASRPVRVAQLVLRQAGHALGLEITARGSAEYRLRGGAQLVVRDVVARQPGARTPVLSADRILLSVPWSTVRARGADLTVRRVELDAPVLDLAALQAWQATRPPTAEPRIPTLTEGLAVERGRIQGSGWWIEALALEVPALHPARIVEGHARATFRNATLRVPMDLRIALARPALDAGVGAVGTATVFARDWRMQLDALSVSGRLRDVPPAGLDRARLGARATLHAGDAAHRFVLGVGTHLRFGDVLTLAPLAMSVRGRDVVPSLDASGRLGLGQALAFDLDGTLATWPGTWPALPPPLGQSGSPLPFVLAYRGATDLSGDTRLRLRRDATVFDAAFRLPRVLAWLDAFERGTPLPPLDGTLVTPTLEIAGATLEGVHVTFEDGEAGASPSKPRTTVAPGQGVRPAARRER